MGDSIRLDMGYEVPDKRRYGRFSAAMPAQAWNRWRKNVLARRCRLPARTGLSSQRAERERKLNEWVGEKGHYSCTVMGVSPLAKLAGFESI